MRIWQGLVEGYVALKYDFGDFPPDTWRACFAEMNDVAIERALKELPNMDIRRAPNVSQFKSAAKKPVRYYGVPVSDPSKLIQQEPIASDAHRDKCLANMRRTLGMPNPDQTRYKDPKNDES